MINTGDIYWAAGFLEGDGSFGFSKARHLWIIAAQVNREPLEKLKEMFGGYIYPMKQSLPNCQPTWRWQAVATRAAGICMTLYSLMSTGRKRQIKKALDGWKAKETPNKFKTQCKMGHALTEDNVYLWRGSRHCRLCLRAADQKRSQRWVDQHGFSRRHVLRQRAKEGC